MYIHRVIGLLVAVLLAAPTGAAVIDIAALRDSGQCTITAFPMDIGSPIQLFDRDWNSVARSPNISPVSVTLEFAAVQPVGASRVRFNAGETYTWRLEAADSLADLGSQSGTYTNVFGPLTVVASPNFEWIEFNDTPVARRVYRFTFDRLTRDDFVHVYELELQSPEPTTTVVVEGQPRRINQISVLPAEQRLVIGQSLQFSAVATLSYGPQSWNVTPLAAWSTGSSTVAAADAAGLISAMGTGVTEVYADIGPVRGAESVEVRQARPVDLNVGFIHRAPEFERFRVDFGADQRIQSGFENAQMWPNPGQSVTFTAAVFNKGDLPASNVVYRWVLDGAVAAQGTIPSLGGGARINLAHTMPWPSDEVQTVVISPGQQVFQPRQLERAIGGHRIRFEIDPGGQITESCELNNAVEDHLGAMAFRFFMEQSTYDRFNNTLNFLESYSAEDWAQMQLRGLQRRLEVSGVQQRVRLDELVVVPDGGLDPGGTHEPRASTTWTPLGGAARSGPDPLSDSRWGFIWPQEYIDQFVKRIENALVHELGHQLGLIDIYNYDIATGACQVRHPVTNQLVAGTSLMPLVSPWNIWYGNLSIFHPGVGTNAWVDSSSRGVMASTGERYFEALHVAGMNRNLGLRRGFYGDFLLAIPQAPIRIRLLSSSGAPVAGASLRVFQRSTAGQVPQNPKFIGTTDASGVWTFPSVTHPAWPGGQIAVDTPWSSVDGQGNYRRGPHPVGGNAPLIVEASFGANVEYHFIEPDQVCVALASGQIGQNDPYTYDIVTYASRRPNQLPVISFGTTPAVVQLNEGVEFSARITATDADGDPVSLTMSHLDNASFSLIGAGVGILTFRPDSLNVNMFTPDSGPPQDELMSVIFRASDGKFAQTRRMTFHVFDVPGFTLLRDTLPPVCAADFNTSGAVTVQDIYDFLAAWQQGTDPRADFNADGSTTVQDIYDFLAAWLAGC